MTPTAQLEALVWQLVASIPAGRVATYGQIARLAGCLNKPGLWAVYSLDCPQRLVCLGIEW